MRKSTVSNKEQEQDEEKEIVTMGMEIRVKGTRDEVNIAIDNLAEDAMEQQKWRDVEIDVVAPVEIEMDQQQGIKRYKNDR